jgi:hypothetical protein
MEFNEHPKFLDPAAIDLAALVFERALRAVGSDDLTTNAHWIRRAVAKRIIEDIFAGERDEMRLLLNCLEHLNNSSRVCVRVLPRPSIVVVGIPETAPPLPGARSLQR